MSNIELVVQGTATDVRGFTELAQRMCAFVEANEPGTLRYDCFADAESGQFLWQEVYESESALLQHLQHLAENRFLDEAAQVADFEAMTALGDISDPHVRGWLAESGTPALRHVTGAARRPGQ